MDASLADSMGVDTENLIFFRQNSAENLLSAIDTLTKSGSIDVIVVDSVSVHSFIACFKLKLHSLLVAPWLRMAWIIFTCHSIS